MRAQIRIAAVVLGFGLVTAACSDAPQEPAEPEPTTAVDATTEPTEDDADAHDHGGHTDHDAEATAPVEGPVAANVLGTSTGSYGELGEGLGSATNTLVVEGTATMVKSESGTEITTEVEGLLSGEPHPAHLHDGSCTEFGGHYMNDHSGPMAPPNEIWLSSSGDPEGPLEPSMTGSATGAGSADWVPRQQPLSMMIHDSEFPGLPIACADFAAYDAPATLVLEATADDVETVEYSINDGDWLAYDGVVEVDEPGSYTVSFAGVDGAGERSEPQEISFEVTGGAL
ncbi:OmpL47-type beta-barrel domain-containing protein [Georgenia sunbinii]|uniref:OmpL47-type beta-barrel domain-containing protein n=1 Tax=Georgenia sunbinii TaxID=3117728 RepID=UPI002F26785A